MSGKWVQLCNTIFPPTTTSPHCFRRTDTHVAYVDTYTPWAIYTSEIEYGYFSANQSTFPKIEIAVCNVRPFADVVGKFKRAPFLRLISNVLVLMTYLWKMKLSQKGEKRDFI